MEYTRSEGDRYETFIGTPEEIANLIRGLKNVGASPISRKLSVYIDTKKIAESVIGKIKKELADSLVTFHEPTLAKVKIKHPGRPDTYKTTGDVICSCGAESCELYKVISEGR